MPGFLVHLGATVLCSHAGQAMPTSPNPRVSVSGQPIVTIAVPYAVVGCPFATASPQPCLTGQWIMGATRVFAGGQPVVLQDSPSVCAPNGTPMNVVVTQTRVRGT